MLDRDVPLRLIGKAGQLGAVQMLALARRRRRSTLSISITRESHGSDAMSVRVRSAIRRLSRARPPQQPEWRYEQMQWVLLKRRLRGFEQQIGADQGAVQVHAQRYVRRREVFHIAVWRELPSCPSGVQLCTLPDIRATLYPAAREIWLGRTVCTG